MEFRGLQIKLAIRVAIAFAIAIAGMAQAVYLIHDELQRAAGKGVGPVIASLERREGTVRRKRNLSFVWYRASEAEELFTRDTLRTGAESEALIRFTNGASLELEENTTVRLDGVREFAISLEEGQAVYTSATGAFLLTRGASGETRIEEIPIRLLSPKPLAILRVERDQTREISLRWDSPKKITGPFSVQVSTRRSFPPELTQALAPEGEAREVSYKAGVGAYFWRVRAAGAMPVQSAVGRFYVRAAEALEPELPKPGARKLLVRADSRIQFRWKAPDVSASAEKEEHWLELGPDEKFAAEAKGLVRKPIRAAAGAENLGELKPGQVFWRIRSRYGDFEVASAARPLEILSAAQAEIKLVSPPSGAVLEPSTPISLAWVSGIKGLAARVEVKQRDSDESVDGGVSTARGMQGSWTWNEPATGRYAWRVTADIDDEIVSETAWRPIRILPGAGKSEIDPADLAKGSSERPLLRSKLDRTPAGRSQLRRPLASPSPDHRPETFAPTGLEANLAMGDTEELIELTWNWNSDVDAEGFEIQAAESDEAEFRTIHQTGPLGRSVRLWPPGFAVPVDSEARFRFRVRAVLGSIGESAYSSPASITLLPPPQMVKLEPGGPSGLNLKWLYPSSQKFSGFRVLYTANTTARDNLLAETSAGARSLDVNLTDPRWVGLENVRLYVRAVPATASAGRVAGLSSEHVPLTATLSYPLAVLEKQPIHYFRLNDPLSAVGPGGSPNRPSEFRNRGATGLSMRSTGQGHLPDVPSLESDPSSGAVQFPMYSGGFPTWLTPDFAPSATNAQWTITLWISPSGGLTNEHFPVQSIFSPGTIPPPPVFPPMTQFQGLRAPWLGLIRGRLVFSPHNVTGLVSDCPPGAIRFDRLPRSGWTFVAISGSGNTFSTYLNGRPSGTACPGDGQPPDAPSFVVNIHLGAGPQEEAVPQQEAVKLSLYHGLISELAVFSPPLSQREIEKLYQHRNAPCVPSEQHGITCPAGSSSR